MECKNGCRKYASAVEEFPQLRYFSSLLRAAGSGWINIAIFLLYIKIKMHIVSLFFPVYVSAFITNLRILFKNVCERRYP